MNKIQKSMVLIPVMLFLLGVSLLIVGCVNPNKSLLELELKNVNMLSDYATYIKNDQTLDELSKKVRLQWIEEWNKRLKMQLEEVGKEE